jgi:Cu/Ag efflux pump CusA
VAGAIVSTILTLVIVPMVYYMTEKKKWENNADNDNLKTKE